MEVDKQLKFKSHQRMQVEFISNDVDVMTHDLFLSSVALALGNVWFWKQFEARKIRIQYEIGLALVIIFWVRGWHIIAYNICNFDINLENNAPGNVPYTAYTILLGIELLRENNWRNS